MPYAFVFVGGLRDGFQVGSDSDCPAERLIADSLWIDTHAATVGEFVSDYRDGGEIESPAYRVTARTEYEGDIIVTCRRL